MSFRARDSWAVKLSIYVNAEGLEIIHRTEVYTIDTRFQFSTIVSIQ